MVNGQARPEFQASAPNSRRWSVHGDSRADQAREQAHRGEDDSVSAMEASRREGRAVSNMRDRAHDSGAGQQVWGGWDRGCCREGRRAEREYGSENEGLKHGLSPEPG